MARVTQVTLVDDLDGSVADETVTFSLDGKDFEIDLNTANAAQLRDAVAPFVGAARRASNASPRKSYQRSTSSTSSSPSSAKSREENAIIRQWAVGNGFEVSERGRISATVLKAYADRDNAAAPVEAPAAETPEIEAKPKSRSRKKATADA